MSKRRRYKPEEKLAAVLEYVNGNKSYTEAGKVVGVDSWTVRDWVFRYKLEGAEAFFSKGKNKQYPEELRKAAVMDYQAGTGSLREICSKYKIREKTQLRMWIEMYNGHIEIRTTGGCCMTKARKTTLEERIAIARECIESGRNYGEIANKYKVSYQQVYNWTNKFAEQGEAGLEDRRGQRTAQQAPRTAEEELRVRIAQLEHELYMTKMERDLLKNWTRSKGGGAESGSAVPYLSGNKGSKRRKWISCRNILRTVRCLQSGILPLAERKEMCQGIGKRKDCSNYGADPYRKSG